MGPHRLSICWPSKPSHLNLTPYIPYGVQKACPVHKLKINSFCRSLLYKNFPFDKEKEISTENSREKSSTFIRCGIRMVVSLFLPLPLLFADGLLSWFIRFERIITRVWIVVIMNRQSNFITSYFSTEDLLSHALPSYRCDLLAYDMCHSHTQSFQ